MPKVSVIIPVFKVEKYIEKCLHSLFSQTLDDIEFIFIDDGTPDNSIEILKETLKKYPSRLGQIKIIFHTKNLGVAAARTSGIKASTGEYIIHCDPDDYVEQDIYEKLYNKAIETNSDIVTCDHYRISGTHQTVQHIYYLSCPQDCLVNWYNKNRNGNYSMLWDKLVRRQIIIDNNIYPYENIDFGEDFGCVVRIFYYSKSIVSINEPLYHYNKRESSYTLSPLTLGMFKKRIKLVDNICRFLKESKYHHFCLNLRFNMKLSGRHLFHYNDKTWYNLYRETYSHILSFKDNSLKSRILWKVALSHFFVYRMLKKNLRILN